MDLLDARIVVDAAIAELPSGTPLALDETSTIETADWWIFFYDTVDAISGSDPDNQLIGAAPVVVDRRSGEVLFAPSGRLLDEFLADLEPGGPNRAW